MTPALAQIKAADIGSGSGGQAAGGTVGDEVREDRGAEGCSVISAGGSRSLTQARQTGRRSTGTIASAVRQQAGQGSSALRPEGLGSDQGGCTRRISKDFREEDAGWRSLDEKEQLKELRRARKELRPKCDGEALQMAGKVLRAPVLKEEVLEVPGGRLSLQEQVRDKGAVPPVSGTGRSGIPEGCKPSSPEVSTTITAWAQVDVDSGRCGDPRDATAISFDSDSQNEAVEESSSVEKCDLHEPELPAFPSWGRAVEEKPEVMPQAEQLADVKDSEDIMTKGAVEKAACINSDDASAIVWQVERDIEDAVKTAAAATGGLPADLSSLLTSRMVALGRMHGLGPSCTSLRKVIDSTSVWHEQVGEVMSECKEGIDLWVWLRFKDGTRRVFMENMLEYP